MPTARRSGRGGYRREGVVHEMPVVGVLAVDPFTGVLSTPTQAPARGRLLDHGLVIGPGLGGCGITTCGMPYQGTPRSPPHQAPDAVGRSRRRQLRACIRSGDMRSTPVPAGSPVRAVTSVSSNCRTSGCPSPSSAHPHGDERQPRRPVAPRRCWCDPEPCSVSIGVLQLPATQAVCSPPEPPGRCRAAWPTDMCAGHSLDVRPAGFEPATLCLEAVRAETLC